MSLKSSPVAGLAAALGAAALGAGASGGSFVSGAHAEAVQAYPVIAAPAGAVTAKAPVLAGRTVLFAPDHARYLSLKAAAVLADGTVALVVHESPADPEHAVTFVHIAARPDGSAQRREGSFKIREPRIGEILERFGIGQYAVRQDGTAAILEVSGNATHLIEIVADGEARRVPVDGVRPGRLVAATADGYLAMTADFAQRDPALQKTEFVFIRRDGSVAWRKPAPKTFGPLGTIAVPHGDGAVALFAVQAEPGALAFMRLRRDGSEGPPVAPSPGRIYKHYALGEFRIRAVPPDGRGGYVLNAAAFATGTPVCGWLDARAKLRFGMELGFQISAAETRRAINCPQGAFVALADGGMIGVRQSVSEFDDKKLSKDQKEELGTIEDGSDIVRLDKGGRRLWRIARANPKDRLDALLIGANATVWAIGTAEQDNGRKVIFAERYQWR